MGEVIKFPSSAEKHGEQARARLNELIDIVHDFSVKNSETWANLAISFTEYQQAFMAYAYLVGEDNVEEEYWELFLGGEFNSQDTFQWDFEYVYDW